HYIVPVSTYIHTLSLHDALPIFLQMINTVNNNFMEHADHLKLLIHDSTFIQLELFGNEEYSPIHFLDNDFNAISSHYMPTDFVNHLTNIYSSKDYKNI